MVETAGAGSFSARIVASFWLRLCRIRLDTVRSARLLAAVSFDCNACRYSFAVLCLSTNQIWAPDLPEAVGVSQGVGFASFREGP
jgi:hypothetical protein